MSCQVMKQTIEQLEMRHATSAGTPCRLTDSSFLAAQVPPRLLHALLTFAMEACIIVPCGPVLTVPMRHPCDPTRSG